MSKYNTLFTRPPFLIKRRRQPGPDAETTKSIQEPTSSPLQRGWQPTSCKRLELLGRRLYSTAQMGQEESDRVKGYGIVEIKNTESLEGNVHIFTEDFPDFIKVYLEKTRIDYGIFHIMQKNMSGKWIEITEDKQEQNISFA